MKKTFEEAAELFRQNEKNSDRSRRQRERANFYRGLALLAEGLHKLERKFDEIEPNPPMPHPIMFRNATRLLRRPVPAPIVIAPNPESP
jgi:hypothetical protein